MAFDCYTEEEIGSCTCTTGFNDNYWESHGGTKYVIKIPGGK